MKFDLKTGYIIEGFDKPEDRDNRIIDLLPKIGDEDQTDPIVYWKETSNISEDLAKTVCEYNIKRCKFTNYSPDTLIEGIKLLGFNYAKESIKSACDKKYCIIYKK